MTDHVEEGDIIVLEALRDATTTTPAERVALDVAVRVLRRMVGAEVPPPVMPDE